jgi:hypothetical protein
MSLRGDAIAGPMLCGVNGASQISDGYYDKLNKSEDNGNPDGSWSKSNQKVSQHLIFTEIDRLIRKSAIALWAASPECQDRQKYIEDNDANATQDNGRPIVCLSTSRMPGSPDAVA